MDNFIVSARKYRPSTFSTVVGQQSITTTLKNAINKNQLAHAYLFFGPRGVGKTTCARIFAKTINCSSITSETEACNTCESCLSFNENRSYNIHELDAASNNSVEDIRNLIDQVRIPPQIGKYSIYIIDEVHMLSLSAFNAFLKTLEEPPKHAIFILATTEKHKIIPTILSRCQIFDFNRIEISDMVGHLQYIAKNEGVNAEDEGLNVIAQKADGAMRDALSIFDQIVSFSGSEINYQSVIDNLNVLDYEYYFKLVDAFMAGNFGSALMIFDEILYKGFDGHNFITGLSKHLRDLLICKDPATISLMEVGASIKLKYQEQSAKCPVPFLLESLEINNKFDQAYKLSNNNRLHVELALLQLSSIVQKKKSTSEPIIAEETEEFTKTEVPEKPIQQLAAVEEKPQVIQKESEPNVAPQASSPASPLIETPVAVKPLEEVPVAVKPKKPNKLSNIPSFGGDIAKVEDAYKPVVSNHNVPDVGKKAEPEEEIIVVDEEKEFTLEALHEQWNNYALKLAGEEPRLSYTLQNHKPVISEGDALILTLTNDSQQTAVIKARPYIVNFLKRNLSNSRITMEVVVGEVEEQEQRYYTQQDKFEYMVTKNPALGELKKQFNLDFD